MLIIEIALGVLIALLVFSYLKKRGETNERKIIKHKEMLSFVKEYIESTGERIEERFIRYLEVFAERMLTLKDDSNVKFQDAAMIELKIFMEQCAELSKKITSEEAENLNLLNIDESYKNQIKSETNSLISSKSNAAQRSALKIMEEKLIDLANES